MTRFDLNSIFGPVAGGAVIDPSGDPNSFFDIGWADGGDAIDIPTPDVPDPMTTFCDPSDPTCSPDIIPPQIAALDFTGFGAVPEPASLTLFATALTLFATALVGLGWLRRRDHRA